MLDDIQVGRDVPGDDHVGALVRGELASGAHGVGEFRNDLASRGVADGDEPGLERTHEHDLLLPRQLLLPLLLQLHQGRHPDQVALSDLAQALGSQDDVQSLIPRHILHADGDRARHGIPGHHVDVAHISEQPKDVVDVGILEVEVDATTAVAALLIGPTSSALASGVGFNIRRDSLEAALFLIDSPCP